MSVFSPGAYCAAGGSKKVIIQGSRIGDCQCHLFLTALSLEAVKKLWSTPLREIGLMMATSRGGLTLIILARRTKTFSTCHSKMSRFAGRAAMASTSTSRSGWMRDASKVVRACAPPTMRCCLTFRLTKTGKRLTHEGGLLAVVMSDETIPVHAGG